VAGGAGFVTMAKPDERLIVTDENFGDLLVQSAQEALAYARGDATKAHVRVRTVPEVLPSPLTNTGELPKQGGV